jgi:hydroxyethylthiazole kinase
MTIQDDACRLLGRVRMEAPLVHCITNFVAMDTAANAVLAIGASPAMVHAKEEVGEFAGISSALTVNIGTLTPDWVESMKTAARAAMAAGKPWVFDPVGVGATTLRKKSAAELVELKPNVVRGNASEIMVLAGLADAGQKGVDSTRTSADAEKPARTLAKATGGVVVVTGSTDVVTDGVRVARIDNGHPMMPRITALGCALTAVTGAFLAVEKNDFLASTVATALFGLAGEIAARTARGPGSLRVMLMDALYNLDDEAIQAGLKVS